ncbi:MAG: fumarylacetoacetate hydrolase family protein [Rhodocyclaceae bacterium]
MTTLHHAQHAAIAHRLREAAAQHRPIDPPSAQFPNLDLDDAIAIQALEIRWREQAGQRRVGHKIGPSVAAPRAGQDALAYGTLFDVMAYGDGEPIPPANLLQARAEAHIALVLAHDLDLARPTYADILQALAYALPAIEISASRLAQPTLGACDAVADNGGAGAFVLGATPTPLAGLDLRLAGMVLQRRGEPVSTGAGAACQGHPFNALIGLARLLAAHGQPLRRGHIVLCGALGPAVPAHAGDVFDAHINGLGSVRAALDTDLPRNTP